MVLQELHDWLSHDAINVDYNEGDVITVSRHEGVVISLREAHVDYYLTDRAKALAYLAHHAAKWEVVAGLLYVQPDSEDLYAHLNTAETPFNEFGKKDLCPGAQMLEKIDAVRR